MSKNAELELAWDFIEKTNRNIFLTGKAGTGKTTFLRKIQAESMKRLVVVAPTGVAAINAKGVTVHSFFQLPFGPILPPDPKNPSENKQQFKFSSTKVNIIKSLDLLIIDEISMVRSDLLDGIDQVLKRYKDREKPFGGVQVLMIGDLQQLAPVIKSEEWHLLQKHYDSPYFFSSLAFKASYPLGIELKHIYRQKDERFINILNEVRTNTLSAKSADVLNERFDPNFETQQNDGYIILTTHNYRAVDMNDKAFNRLKTTKKSYKADVEGKFPEYSYPCLENLPLKIGSQVMFCKNDSSIEKRYFNGKIGEITDLNRDNVTVKCNDGSIIKVEPETWDNLTYSLNSETKEIEEQIAGSFTQIPLKLAWAITIHKSQGLTFEKAVIDAGSSFAHGQTYVALSRCKSLEGIVLKTKISPSSIINDKRVTSFTKHVEENLPDEKTLSESKKLYDLSLIEELFNFYPLLYPTNRLVDICTKNGNKLTGNIAEKVYYLKNTTLNHIFPVASKFINQIKKLSVDIDNPTKDDNIKLRLSKGILYFIEYLTEHADNVIKEISYKTENKALKTDILSQIKIFKEQLSIKLYCFDELKQNYTSKKFLKVRVEAVLRKSKPEKKESTFDKTTEHTLLLKKLVSYRTKCADALGIEKYRVFSEKSLYSMCNTLPVSDLQLSLTDGLGKARIDLHGKDILEIIIEYCKENSLELKEDNKDMLRPKEGSSQHETFMLFSKTKDLREVAKKRDLATSTIESHLVAYISSGDLTPEDILGKERLQEIVETVKPLTFENLNDLRSQIQEGFSYSELKMAIIELEKE